MAWVRLDHTKLRNIGKGNPSDLSHTLAFRVYGWEGKPWPRLTLDIAKSRPGVRYRDTFGLGYETMGFWVACNVRKRSGDCWWGKSDLPTELYADMAELLIEAGEKMKEQT